MSEERLAKNMAYDELLSDYKNEIKNSEALNNLIKSSQEELQTQLDELKNAKLKILHIESARALEEKLFKEEVEKNKLLSDELKSKNQKVY